MKGKSGTALISKLELVIGPDDTIITVGAPATKLMARAFPANSIIAAYALSDGLKGISHESLTVVESSPTLEQLAGALRTVWPTAETIGAFTTADEHPQIPGVTFWKVKSARDIGKIIDQSTVSGFVFTREAALLNRSTIKDVVSRLKQEGIPAIGYSKFLVGTGFPAAYVIDEESYSKKVAQALGEAVDITVDQQNLEGTIWVNKKFARQFGVTLEHAESIGELL